MASPQLIEKLTAEGGGESVQFLNDIVAQLWPHINVAGSKMIKEIAEPMFKTMLPGPLKSLHFTKIDLGSVPMTLSNVLSTKTDIGSIMLDMNVDWVGQADIELDGHMIPKLGVERINLHGRMSILLGPTSDILPLIGAAQIAFINPPLLKLDFTGAAEIADLDFIDTEIRSVILSIINSMMTLPNRFLYKIDVNNDYFRTTLNPLGILRITAQSAVGFAHDKTGKVSKFFSKIMRDSPDTYCKIAVGAEEAWKTSTKDNTTSPVWGETRDFVVTDLNQCVTVDLMDADVGFDRHVGFAATTVRDLLDAGGSQELSMEKKDKPIEGKIALSGSFYPFEAGNNSFSASDHSGEGLLCGLATVLLAGAFDIPGHRKELSPSVAVTWGEKHKFQTAAITDAPGTDINNPAFDTTFRIPITADMINSGEGFNITLMNKKDELGSVTVPVQDVVKAEGMILQNKFAVGGGALVRASICLRGIGGKTMETKSLPSRPSGRPRE